MNTHLREFDISRNQAKGVKRSADRTLNCVTLGLIIKKWLHLFDINENCSETL